MDLLRRLRRKRRKRPVILMYHKIGEPLSDPWGLSVSRANFKLQIEWLAHTKNVLSMTELVERLDDGTLPNDAVAITFDDGYVNNLVEAEPVLAIFNLTASLFIVSGMVGRKEAFWWDELASQVLLSEQSIDLSIELDNNLMVLKWAREDPPVSINWRAWDKPTGPREVSYLALWQWLQRMPYAARVRSMSVLRSALPYVDVTKDRSIDTHEMAMIQNNGHFTLGGHGSTHSPLTALSSDDCAQEIAESFIFCCDRKNSISPGFAYPYGDLSRKVRDQVAAAGFAWACTTQHAAVPVDCDPYQLPRIAARNCSGSLFADELDRYDL